MRELVNIIKWFTVLAINTILFGGSLLIAILISKTYPAWIIPLALVCVGLIVGYVASMLYILDNYDPDRIRYRKDKY